MGRRCLAACCAALAAAGLAAAARTPAQSLESPPASVPVHPSSALLLKDFRFRSIGPASVGGRVDAVAVVESHPSTMYVGFASGGVFKTVNNGTTWTPVFETYSSASIGALAVSQRHPETVWVGTGEANNRQSSTFGDGVYKSTDGGKTFHRAGLEATQTIARIAIDPRDDDIVYVAAPGHLFGPNAERGLYKTTDGGRTWQLSKFIDQDTGFTDVVVDPNRPDTVYAASYQRRRVPWGFNGSGPGSGLWRSADAGRTWTRLTGHGLPDSSFVGRIGLAVSRSKPGVVVAEIELGPSGGAGAGILPNGEESPDEPADDGMSTPGPAFDAEETGPVPTRYKGVPGPEGLMISVESPSPAAPDPSRSGLWRSDDDGRTWRFLSNADDRPMYYSEVRIDPSDDQIVYEGGAAMLKSVDGGASFERVDGLSHSDHHAIWVDPGDSSHLVVGNDGGLDVSYDQGATWEYLNTMAVGQFYSVSADMRKPYDVCGGLQDNGSWCGPSSTRSANGILNADWYQVGSGDGFYTLNDPTDPAIVYVESQDGNVSRVDLKSGRAVNIRPRGARGRGGRRRPAHPNIVPVPPPDERPRFYWNTPLLLSPHDPHTLYVGGGRLYISHDRGDTYTRTVDLTKRIGRNERPIMGVAGDRPMTAKHDGAASYSNIVTISESPVARGVLWVGTNDGNLQISRDGGATWTNVADHLPGVPAETHVSRVEASHVDAGTCYVTLDGHRTDDMTPYVFVTRDFGTTWTSLAGSLPAGNVRVIREDPVNGNLLFLGTEYGLYVTLDGGRHWKPFMNNLPTVRVDDLLIHPREHDLIAATHGRSLWIMDDITPLEQFTDAVGGARAHLFDLRPATQWRDDITLRRRVGGAKHFAGENPPAGAAISYYLREPVTGDVKITITDAGGSVVRELPGPNEAGINRVQWNARGLPAQPRGPGAGPPQAPPVDPGTYLVRLEAGGRTYTAPLVVEADSRLR